MISQKHLATLELPKVLERLAGETSFSAATELALALLPAIDAAEAQRQLAETSEARKALEAIDTLGVGSARDVRDLVRRAARGGMLEPPEMLEISDTLRSARNVQRSLAKHAEIYPLLCEVTGAIDPCVELTEEIARCIDDRGEVRDSASPALGRVRAAIRIAHERLMQKLQRMVSDSNSTQFLQEAIITQRGGRYVIPVKADFKGRIPGVVHDQSSSGMTLFIEPLAVLELNNEWRELQMEERHEIVRILTALSGRIGNERDVLIRNVEALAQFDLALAKAKYADATRAVAPTLITAPAAGEPTLSLRQARHPLLDPLHVVPIDITLDAATRVLVITGPNTGGKTVALKTLGLLSAMAQCGLHVPAEGADLPAFEAIYADIGDEQSIEQSLSTFSAHLTNLVSFLDRVDARALVLLDELGSGTDPIEGAAMARAVLEYLLRKGALCCVATHYAELKSWAALTEGAVNANVAFDVRTLRPLYKLTIGLPGRSNAFAIAQRLGMPAEILDAAQGHTSQDQMRAEDMLAQIARLQRQTEAARDGARRAERNAESNADKLRARLSRIDEERRKLLAEAKEDALREVESLQTEVRRLRARMLAAGGSLEEVKQLQQAAEVLARQAESSAVLEAREPAALAPAQTAPARPTAPAKRPPPAPRRLQVNDTVRVKSLGADGTIAAIIGDEAEVLIGRMRTKVRLAELERARPSEAPAEGVDAYGGTSKYERGYIEPSPGLELDMRGMMAEEGVQRVEDYVDRASRAGLPFVRIIHGKGTGALRKAVRDAIKGNPHVASFATGGDNEGGDGVTVVKLRADS